MKNLWLWTFSAILWNCIFLKLNRSSLLNYFLIDIPLSKIWKKAPAWFLFHILNPYSLQESAWYESGAKCTICATNHHSHKVRIQGIPKWSARFEPTFKQSHNAIRSDCNGLIIFMRQPWTFRGNSLCWTVKWLHMLRAGPYCSDQKVGDNMEN